MEEDKNSQDDNFDKKKRKQETESVAELGPVQTNIWKYCSQNRTTVVSSAFICKY